MNDDELTKQLLSVYALQSKRPPTLAGGPLDQLGAIPPQIKLLVDICRLLLLEGERCRRRDVSGAQANAERVVPLVDTCCLRERMVVAQILCQNGRRFGLISCVSRACLGKRLFFGATKGLFHTSIGTVSVRLLVVERSTFANASSISFGRTAYREVSNRHKPSQDESNRPCQSTGAVLHVSLSV